MVDLYAGIVADVATLGYHYWCGLITGLNVWPLETYGCMFGAAWIMLSCCPVGTPGVGETFGTLLSIIGGTFMG